MALKKFKDLVRNVKMINCRDWDALVEDTYGRPYCLQQQDGCQPRGIVTLKIPDEAYEEEEMHDKIPEIVNGPVMGVKFEKWLERDPKQPLKGEKNNDWSLSLWWNRNFYPDIQTVANDLHKKGLIEAGEYSININW
jgi:hypothetical protein